MAFSSESDSEGSSILARYLVTKITFWGSYCRILTVNSFHIAIFNAEDFKCTDQWLLSDIIDIEIPIDPDQFVVVVAVSRFRSVKFRFHCHARSHLLALVHSMRRDYAIEPIRLTNYNTPGGQRLRQLYECTEHFADDSYDLFVLQIGVAGVSLLDENGNKVAQFPFVNMLRIACSTAHPDGLVISTMFQERLFLCHPRGDCIADICAAAQTLGINLPVEQSPLNMQLLRLRNSQALDNPAVVCFDVIKDVDDGKIVQPIQLIFQGTAIVEVHRKVRTTVTRPYSTLLNIMRAEWDGDTVIMQFVHGDNLIVRVESRDQFISILLLVCREAGNNHVELTLTLIKTNRLFHPHMTENVRETAGTRMETFLLQRVLEAITGSGHDLHIRPIFRGFPIGERENMHAKRDKKRTKQSQRPHSRLNDPRSLGRRNKQKRGRHGLRSNAVMMEAHLAVDTGVSLDDHMSVAVAMEELNANIPLGGLSGHCSRQLLAQTMDALVEHLISLVSALRSYIDAPSGEIITVLQVMARLAQSPHTFFPEALVTRLFDALYELIQRQHFLTCFWVLKLVQYYFEPRKSVHARRYRAKALQNFVENRFLLYAILDLIPMTSSLSSNSSGRWMRPGSDTLHSHDDSSDAHLHQNLDETLLFTKEERMEKDMNILTYEALFTLHHVLIYLQARETNEAELATMAAREKDMKKYNEKNKNKHNNDWANTIELDDRDEMELHQCNYLLAVAAKEEIGDKLLAKYKFLMDAVVDVRLQRACQSIVALIHFIVHYVNESMKNDKIKKEAALFPTDEYDIYGTILYQIGSEEASYRRQDRARESLPMRRSSLDDDHRVAGGHDGYSGDADGEQADRIKTAQRTRQVDELFAFLECYQADVATLDDRSRLFQDQRTILVPLMGFSQATSRESSKSFQVSDFGADIKPKEAYMKLEYLEMDPDDQETPQEQRPKARKPQSVQRAGTSSEEIINYSLPRAAPSQQQQLHPQQLRGIHEEAETKAQQPSMYTDGFSISDVKTAEGESVSYVPRFMMSSNFRRLDEARNQTMAKLQSQQRKMRAQAQSDRGSVALSIPREQRPNSHAGLDRRLTAHACDACIACNDVCGSENCFFCAEKQYQLRMAFGESSSTLPRHRDTHSTVSMSSSADRKYSSCEVRRHQTVRSCWVVVDRAVYDVTDLLSSHPGGMNVLLNAAQSGEDCGDLFLKKHPPSSRRVLENYRLGDAYHCETRTLLY